MAEDPGAGTGKRRRMIIIGVGGLLVAACVGLALKFLLDEDSKPPAKPVAQAPKPAADAAKPAADAPKPAAEAPKPAAEAPKPAAGAPKPMTEAPKPAAAPQPAAKPAPAPVVAAAPVKPAAPAAPVAKAPETKPEPPPVAPEPVVKLAGPGPAEEAPKPAPPPAAEVKPKPVALAPRPPGVPGPRHNDLTTAIMYGDVETVAALLAMGKWVDRPDSRGRTPLMTAVALDDAASAELLLKAGADPDRALYVAREYRNQAMEALLQRYGAR